MSRKGIPSNFIEMDPEDALKAVNGYDDVLAGETKKIEALYRQHTNCPRGCGPTMQKYPAPLGFIFNDPNWLVPRCLLRCSHCGCVYNPFDGMIVELGKPDEANAGGLLIKTDAK